MEQLSLSAIDEFSKHLRLVQVTCVVSCITLLALLLSEKETVIRAADHQIEQINRFTSKNNWNANFANDWLNSTYNKNSMQFKEIFLDPEVDKYVLCLDESCKEKFYFKLKYQPVLFKRLKSSNPADPGLAIKRPQTVKDFQVLYDQISDPCCIYEITGIEGREIKIYHDKTEYVDDTNTGYYTSVRGSTKALKPRGLGQAQIRPNQSEDTTNVQTHSAYIGSTLRAGNRRIPDEHQDPSSIYLVIDVAPEPDEQLSEHFLYVLPLRLKQLHYGGAQILDNPDWILNGYQNQFDALHELSKNWSDVSIASARKIVAAERLRKGDSFDFIGIKVPANLALSFGGLLIASVQIYFLLHLKILNSRLRKGCGVATEHFPHWLSQQGGSYGNAVFLISVILFPLATATSLTLTSWLNFEATQLFQLSWTGIALAIICGTCCALVREHHELLGIIQKEATSLYALLKKIIDVKQLLGQGIEKLSKEKR